MELKEGDLVRVIKSNSAYPMKGQYAIILEFRGIAASIILLNKPDWLRIYKNQHEGYWTMCSQLKLMYRPRSK